MNGMKRGLFYTLGLSKGTFSKNFFLVLAVLVLAVMTVTPIWYVKKYLMALWILLFVITLGYISNSNIKLKRLGVLGIAFIAICTIYKLIGVSSASLPYCLTPLVYFGPVVALIIIEKCDNENQVRFLFHFISLAIAINILDSIRITQSYGYDLVYQQLSEMLEEQGVTNLNLGGSLFVTMVVFYVDVVFLAFLKSRRVIEKVLFLLYFGIGFYFIFFISLKASAIMLMLLSILLLYIASRSGKNIGRIFFLSAFFGIVLVLFRDAIINFLISAIDSERITSRLIVFTSTENVSESGTLMSREGLWLVSLKTWFGGLGNFIFGIGDHNFVDFVDTASTGVGNHSDLLDVFARYGLMGGTILYATIKIYYDYLKKRYGDAFRWEIAAFFILIILMGLTKKFVAGEPAIIIFVLFPLCLRYLSYSQGIQHT